MGSRDRSIHFGISSFLFPSVQSPPWLILCHIQQTMSSLNVLLDTCDGAFVLWHSRTYSPRHLPFLLISLLTFRSGCIKLRTQLASSITGRTWRTEPQYFNREDMQVTGCLELSPARHQMGHYVGIYLLSDAPTHHPIFSMRMPLYQQTLTHPRDFSGCKI